MNWLCANVNPASRGNAVSAVRTLLSLAHGRKVKKVWTWFDDARQVAQIVAPEAAIPSVDLNGFWQQMEDDFDVGLDKLGDMQLRNNTMAILRAERGLRAQDVAVIAFMDFETVPPNVAYSKATEMSLWLFRSKSEKLAAGSSKQLTEQSKWERLRITQEPAGRSKFAKSPRYQKTFFGVWLEEHVRRVRKLEQFPKKPSVFHGKQVYRDQLFLPVSKYLHRFLWEDEGNAGRVSVFRADGIGKATFSVLRRANTVTAADMDDAGIKCTPKHFRHFAATYFDQLLVVSGEFSQEQLQEFMRHSGSGSLKNYTADNVPQAVRDRLASKRVNKLPHFLIRI